MFARFDENPAMTLQVIKETKRYGRTDGQTDARTDNVKTVYPLQTKFAGGINMFSFTFFAIFHVFYGGQLKQFYAANFLCFLIHLKMAVQI